MRFVALVFCLSLTNLGFAEVRFARIFTNNMVIQQETEAPVWGTAEPGEEVTVKASWRGGPVKAKADDEGVWRAVMKTPKAGGPYEMRATAKSGEVVLANVLLGEVWLCGGQSNMQWKMRGFGDVLKPDADKANYPKIRLYTVPQDLGLEPQDDLAKRTRWMVCSPQSVLSFSAVGYYFASQIFEETKVPIGLVSCNWGGSSAEAWMREETLREDFPDFSEALDNYPAFKESVGKSVFDKKQAPKGLRQTSPAVLYNAMLKPVMPMAMRGVIWYQGESNVKEPEQYRTLFPALIRDWRAEWGQGDFPFYYVQIAPFHYRTNEKPVALLREAQLMALSEPNTGMVVTMDVGDPTNIHPKKKKPVGERLALLALAKEYGQKDLVYSGPLYREMKEKSGEIWLKFDHVGGGLKSRDGEELSHFQVAGKDRQFTLAEARISGDYVVVKSEKVKKPVAVRYGWGNADEPNLMNAEGLPASSFRTDDWE